MIGLKKILPFLIAVTSLIPIGYNLSLVKSDFLRLPRHIKLNNLTEIQRISTT